MAESFGKDPERHPSSNASMYYGELPCRPSSADTPPAAQHPLPAGGLDARLFQSSANICAEEHDDSDDVPSSLLTQVPELPSFRRSPLVRTPRQDTCAVGGEGRRLRPSTQWATAGAPEAPCGKEWWARQGKEPPTKPGWAEPRTTARSQCSVKHPGHRAGAHATRVNQQGMRPALGERMWWTAGTTRGGAGHLGLTHTETQRGRLWTA